MPLPEPAALPTPRVLVLDTNIALDLLVFEDPATAALREALASGQWQWLALPEMRAEFARVLEYPPVAAWRLRRGQTAQDALDAFDAASRPAGPVARSPLRCRDPDDQPFVDLAIAHAALLLSKDRDVLALKIALASRSVEVSKQILTNRHPRVEPG